jgi:hypothetical protein
MKKALFAAILVAMGGYMAPASAVTITTSTNLGDITGLAKNVGNTFGAAAYGSSFSDLYTFDLSTASQSVGTTVTIDLSVGPLNFQLSNMAIKLTDSTGATTYAMDNTMDASNALQLSASLTAGTGYRFLVTGDVTGNIGGAYGGVLQAAPVPEAETYAMMLAGLGLVGFMALRRTRMVV